MKRMITSVSAALLLAVSAMAQQSTTGATTEATQIQEQVSATPSPWGASILLETVQTNLRTENTTVTQDNFFSVTYKHNDTYKSALRVETIHTLYNNVDGASTTTDKFELGDMAYTLSNSGLFEIPSLGIKGTGFARLYAPTSSASLDSGMITRFRPQVEATREFGKVLYVTMHDRMDFFLRKDFVTTSIGDDGTVTAARHLAYDNWAILEVGANFLDGWNAYMRNYLINLYSYGDASVGAAAGWDSQYSNELGLGYSFLQNYNITAYVQTFTTLSNVDRMYRNADAGALDTGLYLDLSANF